MAFRRMVNQYQTLMQNGDTQGLRNDRATLIGSQQPTDSDQAFVDHATMTEVNAIAGGVVFYRGRSAKVRQVNDEPLTAGQAVFISKTLGGEFIVHGSDKS